MPPAAVIAVEAVAVVRKRRRDSGREMRTGMGASGVQGGDECPQNMSARATSS
jgi:hypothetical protein